MTKQDDNYLEDLELTQADDVKGGYSVTIDALGNEVTVQADENKYDGYDVTAGDTEVRVRRDNGRIGVEAERGGDDIGGAGVRVGN